MRDDAALPSEASRSRSMKPCLQPGSAAVSTEEILAVDQALDQLARLNARQASVVELRYFGGLSVDETAEVLGVAERTVKLDWAMAKGWMKSHLSAGGNR
jgi:RNA polymerase sigma factor (sigma-70 family)